MDDELDVCKMLHLSKQHNHLKDRVEQDRIDNNTSAWLRISSALDFCQTFPKVQEHDLRELTLCIYEIQLIEIVHQEHINDDEILVNTQDANLLMRKIQSRHISNKVYKQLWIEYDEDTS